VSEDEISKRLAKAVAQGLHALNLEESRTIAEMAGIPFNRSGLAASPKEAVKLAEDIGYPLVMKIVSPQVIHKTEVGGVKVNVAKQDDVKKAYKDIIDSVKSHVPDVEIKGILLEEMVKGPEFIIGTTIDQQFGPMIMFGVGGIYVEVYKDVSFRLIPITKADAEEMLTELKGKAILHGIRGLPEADPEQLSEILLRVSALVDRHKDIAEMDINPLIVTERGALAVDARIILKMKG
jgi:acyl-CoA synthetase (NDP forming)